LRLIAIVADNGDLLIHACRNGMFIEADCYRRWQRRPAYSRMQNKRWRCLWLYFIFSEHNK